MRGEQVKPGSVQVHDWCNYLQSIYTEKKPTLPGIALIRHLIANSANMMFQPTQM